MVPRDQILMGVLSAVLCLAGFWNARWFLSETTKGRALTRWLGSPRDLWVLRGLFLAGLVFGVLLAVGVIEPLQWD